jgi:RHS repeat-associated protein
MITTANGWPIWGGTFAPYGQEINPTITTNHFKFTSKERDTEDNLDYFGARYYSSTMGRWLTPDWAAAPTAVPYADFGNPQSLNLYGYVGNDPLFRADLDGHGWDDLKRTIGGALNAFNEANGFNLPKLPENDLGRTSEQRLQPSRESVKLLVGHP